MNTKIANLMLLAVVLFLISACKEEVDPPTPSSGKSITSFEIAGVSGVVDETDKTISVFMPQGTDLTALTPTIAISAKAIISPASGVEQDFTNTVTYTVTAEDNSTASYFAIVATKCANDDNVYSFTYAGKNYDIVKEKKTWVEAAICAVERGGYLAEVNSAAENTALFNEAMNNANITLSNTVSPDGGSASYIWLGGNDKETEGAWMWDGDDDGTGTQFWLGKVNGAAVGGAYTNWGHEPDDYNDNQDGLGLALTQWPLSSGSLGSPGKWNDVAATNKLYFIVEYD